MAGVSGQQRQGRDFRCSPAPHPHPRAGALVRSPGRGVDAVGALFSEPTSVVGSFLHGWGPPVTLASAWRGPASPAQIPDPATTFVSSCSADRVCVSVTPPGAHTACVHAKEPLRIVPKLGCVLRAMSGHSPTLPASPAPSCPPPPQGRPWQAATPFCSVCPGP